MTDQELKDLVASLAISQADTDAQMAKTDEKINRIASLVGNISNNQGDIAEEYFVNSLEEQLKVGSVNFDYLIQNFKAKRARKILAEYDILLINGESVAIVEVKYKAHLNDLDKLPEKIEQLRALPQYKNYKIYAGIASFYVTNKIVQKAKELGFFILQRKGDVIITHAKNLKAA